MVYEAPKKMLLYGDACRVSTDPIAKASYFFDLIQVSTHSGISQERLTQLRLSLARNNLPPLPVCNFSPLTITRQTMESKTNRLLMPSLVFIAKPFD